MITIFLNRKLLGLTYILLSIFGGSLGMAFSIVLRIELNNPFEILGDYFYNVSLTCHGILMLFFFLIPLIYGVYYLVIVIYNKSERFYFLRFSLLSFIGYLISIVITVTTLILGESLNSGWTLYVPLTSLEYNNNLSLDILILSLNIFLTSSIFNYIQIFYNSLQTFFRFESLLDTPIIIWSFFLTSLLGLLSTPSLICVLTLLIFDRNFNTYYFDCEFGGSVLLFQSLFWVYSHPVVYVFIIPVFGVISEVLQTLCKGYIYNKVGIIFSINSLSIISFLVWGHHMSTTGWGLDIKGFFMISTVIISLPTGVKVFSWLYSLVLYGKRFSIVSGFLGLFLIFFSLGGITGVFLANYTLDVFFHDSYFVVGHFHMVLASSSIFGFLSGLFLMYSEIFNNFINIIFMKTFWSLFFIIFSFNLFQLFYFFHLLGLLGTPRRILLFTFNIYLISHFCSLSFLNILISFFLFIFLILLSLNN